MKNEVLVIWFHRLLRWSFAGIFITTGIIYYKDGAWPAILMGLVLLVTGFFKPKRCMDNSCNL